VRGFGRFCVGLGGVMGVVDEGGLGCVGVVFRFPSAGGGAL